MATNIEHRESEPNKTTIVKFIRQKRLTDNYIQLKILGIIIVYSYDSNTEAI